MKFSIKDFFCECEQICNGKLHLFVRCFPNLFQCFPVCSATVQKQTLTRIFFYLDFFSRTFSIHKAVGEGEGHSLIPLYHFQPLHRHLNIRHTFAAEILPLHIVDDRTRIRTFSFWTQVANNQHTRPVHWCSIGQWFWKISHSLLKKICDKLLQKNSITDIFLWVLQNFPRNLFYIKSGNCCRTLGS